MALLLSLSLAGAPAPAGAETQIPIRGIDVSRYQGDVDWAAVAGSGVQFAMLRLVCEGSDNTEDTKFEDYYAGAVQNGVKVGAYVYTEATDTAEAAAEADACLQYLDGRHLDYPIAYDVEDSNQYTLSIDELGAIVQTFCFKIRDAGYTPMVYGYKNFFENYLTSPLVRQFDLWVAHWTEASTPDFAGHSMWQYSNSGSVPGISGRCDLDYSYVDYAAGGGGGTPPTVLDPLTFECDTSSYAFGTNRNYTYKITTPDTYPPKATSSNPSVVTVSGPKAIYNGFLFTLTNVGKGSAVITTTAGDGRSVSFPVTGTGTSSAMRCDTSSYTFPANATSYIYKITTDDPQIPTAASSNPSAVTVSYLKPTTGGYLYRIDNVGKGTATITTTASDGTSVSFPATGNAGSGASYLRCDTSSYTFPANATSYIYKITTDAAQIPTASSSNPSAVAVSYLKPTTGGYLYRIGNVGKGTATITTTASDGTSVSFPATGNAGSGASYLRCDTGSYVFGTNLDYIYKITTDAAQAPAAKSSNPSAVPVAYLSPTPGGYLYRIGNAGKGTATITTTASGGTSVSFQATGSAGSAEDVRSDTPYFFMMKKGNYYQYKFTGKAGVSYHFVCAASGVIQSASLKQANGSYYLTIYAAGQGCAGIYASWEDGSQRVSVVTVQ